MIASMKDEKKETKQNETVHPVVADLLNNWAANIRSDSKAKARETESLGFLHLTGRDLE